MFYKTFKNLGKEFKPQMAGEKELFSFIIKRITNKLHYVFQTQNKMKTNITLKSL